MSDNLDLRKRILKMREINNLDSRSIESFNFNQQDTDLIKIKKENILETDLKNTKNQNIINNNPKTFDHNKNLDIFLNSKQKKDTSYDAQFRLLANKFNEAVEVILELSDKVKNLEKNVYLKNKKINKIGQRSKVPNLKIIVFIILILLFALGIIYLPINFLTLKLILSDISSLI